MNARTEGLKTALAGRYTIESQLGQGGVTLLLVATHGR